MKPKIRLLVTDLDNTLYDWVTFFVAAFYEMVDVAVDILETDRERLLDELRLVHRQYHNSEQPFALLETATVRERYAGLSREEQARRLDPAFHAFNSARKRTLNVYPSVIETLTHLRGRGIRVVAHTEATVTNAQLRLAKLGLGNYIERLYALEHEGEPHPMPGRLSSFEAIQQVRLIRHDERKPDPRVLFDIVRDVGIPLSETLYVGDSLVRDVGMAKQAGAWAAWARYGTQFDPKAWDALVRVTHWTDEDVWKAQVDKARLGQTKPDCVLTQYSQILNCFDFAP
jgi:FMN phosphatase YigB (HAD superfamily)